MRRGARRSGGAATMAQEAFSDYHLYTLGRKTTINNNETKQVSMLEGTGVPGAEALRRRRPAVLLPQRAAPGAPIKDVVQVYYQFKNEEKAGLGMPMPAGVVRVYQADSKGGVQFVGEDRIMHTPKDEKLKQKKNIRSVLDVEPERSKKNSGEHRLTISQHRARPQAGAPGRAAERGPGEGARGGGVMAYPTWLKPAASAGRFPFPVEPGGGGVGFGG